MWLLALDGFWPQVVSLLSLRLDFCQVFLRCCLRKSLALLLLVWIVGWEHLVYAGFRFSLESLVRTAMIDAGGIAGGQLLLLADVGLDLPLGLLARINTCCFCIFLSCITRLAAGWHD